MANGLFAKIAKGLLIGGGTVLSLFAPAIGAPLVVAGTAINPKGSNASNDLVSTYSQNLATSMNLAGTMSYAGNQAVKLGWLDQLKIWIMSNPVGGIILGIIAVLGLKALFGKK